MAKVVALIATALCVLALASFGHCQKDAFNVGGLVYCDTCRVLFPTRISTYIADAEVELNCRSRDNGTVTYTVSGKTNKDGRYSLAVTGDHEDEVCDVSAVNSPDDECSESVTEINTARISLAENSGIESGYRYCNPIGFRKTKSLPECTKVLDELGFVPINV